MHPVVCTSGGTLKCGSTTSRSGYVASDARVEVNRQAREEAGDARQLEKLHVVRGVVPGRKGYKILGELESEAATDENIHKKSKCRCNTNDRKTTSAIVSGQQLDIESTSKIKDKTAASAKLSTEAKQDLADTETKVASCKNFLTTDDDDADAGGAAGCAPGNTQKQ